MALMEVVGFARLNVLEVFQLAKIDRRLIVNEVTQ